MALNRDEMWSDLLSEFEATVSECQKMGWITRGRELISAARDKAISLKATINKMKAEYVAFRDEESANRLLCLMRIVDALMLEMEMWIALKDDKASSAWQHLVGAQMAGRDALLAHDTADELGIEGYVKHLYDLEKLLFPPQTFVSMGVIVKDAKCSICEQKYGTCDHIVGQPYMGELCARHITEISDILEVSIVLAPASKINRVETIIDDGIARDTLTWREVVSVDDND